VLKFIPPITVEITSLENFSITLNLGPCCKTMVTSAKSADWSQKSRAFILKVISYLLPGPSRPMLRPWLRPV
jgi:hypothetical protein